MNVSLKCPVCDVVGSYVVGDCLHGDHMREFKCPCGTKLVIELIGGFCKGFYYTVMDDSDRLQWCWKPDGGVRVW